MRFIISGSFTRSDALAVAMLARRTMLSTFSSGMVDIKSQPSAEWDQRLEQNGRARLRIAEGQPDLRHGARLSHFLEVFENFDGARRRLDLRRLHFCVLPVRGYFHGCETAPHI